MSKYSDLELPALMDLLIKYTEEYTRMVSYRVFSVEEFSQCKQALLDIHAAIKEKTSKNGKQNLNILSNHPNNLPGDPAEGGHRA